MGGKPSKGTKKDKRLKENPKAKPKRPRREGRRRSASTLSVNGGTNL